MGSFDSKKGLQLPRDYQRIYDDSKDLLFASAEFPKPMNR